MSPRSPTSAAAAFAMVILSVDLLVHARGSVIFSTARRGTKSPTRFTMRSRVYVPYGRGMGYAFGMGAVEKSAFDRKEKYLYTVSEQGYVNVVDYGSPEAPAVVTDFAIDLAGKELTDVAVCAEDGHLFVAYGAGDRVSDGKVNIYSTAKRSGAVAPALSAEVTVGPLPDMISPNADCSMLAVANEGEGAYSSSGGLTDPEGSVSIVTDLNASVPTVANVPFTSLGSDADLIAKGVHLPLSKNAMEYWDDHSSIADFINFSAARASYTTAMNLEPEYLGWSGNGDRIFVTLQENSAIVTVHVPPAAQWASTPPTAERIDAMGLKDWSSSGETQGIDLIRDDACMLKKFAGYRSMQQPDSIAVVTVDGVDYILTANEGDEKEYGKFEEEMKANEVVDKDGSVVLNGMAIDPTTLANYKAQNDALADSERRVTVGSASIDYSTPAAPKIIDMVGFGGRGISIWKPSSDALELVWDSGSQLEIEQCKKYPWAHNGEQSEQFALVDGTLYNASGSSLQQKIRKMNDPGRDGCSDRGDGKPGACPLGKTVDWRSPKDGAAPEAMAVGVACGRLIAVTATEKQGTAFVYDITNITAPELLFVEQLSPASETKSPSIAYAARELGEIDSEGIVFLDEAASPSGKAAVLFGGAWSGTVSMWEFECPTSWVRGLRGVLTTTAAPTTEGPTSSAPRLAAGTGAAVVAACAATALW